MSTINKKEWQKEHFKTNKIPTKSVCLQTRVTWLKLLGSKFDPKNESAVEGTSRLAKDRSRKSGSIQDRSLTKLTPV